MWKKVDEYHIRNGDWTICKTGKENVRYGLWFKSTNHGWFDTSAEAIEKWKELNR